MVLVPIPTGSATSPFEPSLCVSLRWHIPVSFSLSSIFFVSLRWHLSTEHATTRRCVETYRSGFTGALTGTAVAQQNRVMTAKVMTGIFIFLIFLVDPEENIPWG